MLLSRPFLRAKAPSLLLVSTFVLYLAYLTQTYYWDGVLFSLNIEGVHRGELQSSVLFHANHLLYSAFGYVLYSAVLTWAPGVRAVTVLQVSNALVSCLAGFALYRVAKRLTQSTSIALFCSVLFAFGATWWKFSTDADSYIFAVFLLILASFFALRDHPKIAAAAVCHTLAMLFHELSVFMYAPILAAIALDSRRPIARRFWVCLAYLAGTGSLVVAIYLICYVRVARWAYPSLLTWVTSYASDSGFTHSISQLLGSYLTSYIKLFLGGKLGYLRDYFSIAICVSLLIAIAALIAAFLLFKRPAAVEGNVTDRSLVLLWVWVVTYALFLACWDPGSVFHKLFVWQPIVLLIGAYVARRAVLRERAKAFLAVAVAMVAWNFGAFIYPHSHASADPVLSLAQQIDRELPKNATIYYKALDPDDWYLEYFAPGRKWLKLPGGATAISLSNGTALSSGPVCLETTALEAQPSPHIDPRYRWDLVNTRHNLRLECLAQARPN